MSVDDLEGIFYAKTGTPHVTLVFSTIEKTEAYREKILGNRDHGSAFFTFGGANLSTERDERTLSYAANLKYADPIESAEQLINRLGAILSSEQSGLRPIPTHWVNNLYAG